MALKFVELGTVFVIGACLFLSVGCHSAGVYIGDEPTYRHEPPPRQGGGPPPWAPAHGYRAKHKYRYYPSSHVYYDTGRRLYFFSEGRDWRLSASLPSSIHIEVNDYVTLEMDDDRPYRYHSEVVKRYPPGKHKQKSKGKGKDKRD